jgi:hypothetical protein
MSHVIGNQHGGGQRIGDTTGNDAGPARPSVRRPVWLLLGANPWTTPPLRRDTERREIRDSVTLAEAGARVDIQVEDAVRRDDLRSALLRHEPAVVHFGGHAGKDGLLLVEQDGEPRPVSPAALTELFRILGSSVRCVVLNACATAEQGARIAAHVPCVVGMFGPVQDGTAIRFAAGFYEGLARGKPVGTAFQHGRNRLSLHELSARPPVLHAAAGVAETTFVLAR